MPRPVPRKFTLADLMVLISATAFGLGCYVFVDDRMFRGQRYMYGIFRHPAGGWIVRVALERCQGVLAMALTVCGAWAFALPLLERRRVGGHRPRPWRRPGYLACVAAVVGLGVCGGTVGLGLLARWSEASPPPRFRYHAPVVESVFIFPGIAVAAAWVALLAMGRWRAAPDPLDRLGRALGGLWIVSGLVFAVSLFQG